MKFSKGSRDAWIVKDLLEAWIDDDGDRLEAALLEADEDLAQVTGRLVLVCGGTVQGIASAARISHEEALAFLWPSFADLTGDDSAAEVARTVVTAWSTDPTGDLAEHVNRSGMLNEVEPREVIMHLLLMSTILARRFTEELGQPFNYATEGWWQALGVEGERPLDR